MENRKKLDDLILKNKELASKLFVIHQELVFQNEEQEKRAAELLIENKELASKLFAIHQELVFQNEEKEKRAAELLIANKELVFQNEEKAKRAEELIIANNNLEQFAYIASHDLQEPLRTISNYMQVFEEDYLSQLDENAKKYLYEVKAASNRMSVLIKSLLDFSRLGLNLNLIEVDCNQLLKDVISDLQTIIKTSNTVIEVAEMPKLNLYEPEFRQLFQNLIVNAIKYQKKNNQPKIRIRSEKMNNKWKFSITDNGIGIAPVHFKKIFDIFQRIHNNENIYEGKGIGLANCKKIVQMHSGEIWVESVLGKGTTFNFTILNRVL